MDVRTIAILALVGCGSAQRPPQIVNTTEPAVGCPVTKDVWLASYSGERGTAQRGWFLPLGAQMIDEPGDPSDPRAMADRPMTEDEAAQFMPQTTSRPWLMMPGRAPCEMTYGAKYVAIVTDGMWNRSFRVELDGCPVPKDGKADAAFVVFAERAPTDCHVARSYPVAAFTNYELGAKPEPVPAELAKLVGSAKHGQALLWRIRAIDVRDKPMFWSIDTSRIKIGKPGDECNWDTTNLGMMYERTSGAIVPFSYAHDSRAMEVYQHLFGALVERERIHSVLVTNLGEYQVFDLATTPRVVGHHRRWYIPHEEDYAGDGVLGPYCGP
jgi:hypothetical protein